MREIIRPLELKITKKTVTVSTIVGAVPWGNLNKLVSGHLCLLLLHELAAQCEPVHYATPAIHAVVVA